MTTTFLFLGKLLASSAMLYAFYWLVLRNRASYTMARIYLLLLPVISLMMSGLTFEVWQVEAEAEPEIAAPSVTQFVQPAAPAPVELLADAPADVPDATAMQTVISVADAPAAPTVVTYDAATLSRWLVMLWAAVAIVLITIALYHIIGLWLMSRRMTSQRTAEGFSLVRSADVDAPCSFARTVFMPADLAESKADLILRHEKAHIRHAHYVDVWVIELMARLLWLNPFIWLARKELRNIHEFQADHDVLTGGAQMNVYQTLLLEQVMANGNDYANGFNHSFIRRRFIEMKHSTAGTLGKMGKFSLVAWVAAMFCVFTFSECEVKSDGYHKARPMSNEEFRLSLQALDLAEPELFTIEGTVDEAITDSCYNIYLADEFLEIDTNTVAACVPVVDKKFHYSIPLKRLTTGRLRCIFPGGELCSAHIELWFVPGETVQLTVHNGHYELNSSDYLRSYMHKVVSSIDAIRTATNWNSSHLPEFVEDKVTHWEDVSHNPEDGYDGFWVKEVILGPDITVVRLMSNNYMNHIRIDSTAYLTDENGNRYALRNALYGDVGGNNKAKNIFGVYLAFETVPADVKSLAFYKSDKVTVGRPTIGNIHNVAASAKKEETHEYVDLGLPSGLLWATCNVGADKPEDFGYFLAWGETQPKETYSWSNYKYWNDETKKYTKYNSDEKSGVVDSKVFLDDEDDAATSNWGGEWRMPSINEWWELNSYCQWTEVERNGVKGVSITGVNGNSIFIPHSGFRENEGRYTSDHIGVASSESPYWTKNIHGNAQGILLIHNRLGSGVFHRPQGHAVRAVRPAIRNNAKKQVATANASAKNNVAPAKTDVASAKNDVATAKNDVATVRTNKKQESVDLGLPSGLLWATCNVGASRPEDFGAYYAWGETKTKGDYNEQSYKHAKRKADGSHSLTKYNTRSEYGAVDNKLTLEPNDDAAVANLGEGWHTPSKAEWEELQSKCHWTWTQQNGVNGYKVVGPNGKSIFLPAVGIRYGSSLNGENQAGYYLSSTLHAERPNWSWNLLFNAEDVSVYHDYRRRGQAVRAVRSANGQNAEVAANATSAKNDVATANFKIDVTVSQGINDSGYLIHHYDDPAHCNYRSLISRIKVENRHSTYESHLDEAMLGTMTATFPDGSVCSAWVWFPFVPGEQAVVKVKNGTFSLDGSGFYQQWAGASELIENARQYRKRSETDKLIQDYLKEHSDEEGCLCYYWQYNIVPKATILRVMSPDMRNGRLKKVFDVYDGRTI